MRTNFGLTTTTRTWDALRHSISSRTSYALVRIGLALHFSWQELDALGGQVLWDLVAAMPSGVWALASTTAALLAVTAELRLRERFGFSCEQERQLRL